MPQKLVEIDGIGQALLVRQRKSKHLRLSFSSKGQLRITMPYFMPYAAGLSFAKSKKEWILKHKPKQVSNIYINGQKVGRFYKLVETTYPLKNNKAVQTTENSIFFNPTLPRFSTKVLEDSINKCLKVEAIEVLPSRLNKLADIYDYKYKDVKIKKMHSRWGSCSNTGVIALSYYLVQLPDELIDYVLMHELVHTRHMDHSQKFWNTLENELPDLKRLRKELKLYRPAILTSIS